MIIKTASIRKIADGYRVTQMLSVKGEISVDKELGEAKTLIEARKKVPKVFSYCLLSPDKNDPDIIETWV